MCCCCASPITSGIAAIVSCVLALYLIYTSEPVFTSMYHAYQDPTYRMATNLLDKFDNILTFLGARKIDAGKPVRILMWAAGITLIAGGCQILSSVLLLFGAARQNRASVLSFSFVSVFGCMICCGCWYATQNYFPMTDETWRRDTPPEIQNWQLAMMADGLYLMLATCHTLCFVRSERRAPVLIRGSDGITYTARTV